MSKRKEVTHHPLAVSHLYPSPIRAGQMEYFWFNRRLEHLIAKEDGQLRLNKLMKHANREGSIAAFCRKHGVSESTFHRVINDKQPIPFKLMQILQSLEEQDK